MKPAWGILGLCLLSVSANAALLSRAGGLAYYDSATNLTWVADANLAQTSGYDADGLMSWTAAQGWIASLNAQNAGLGYLGVNAWRLSTVTDTGASGCDFGYTGTDCGFNMNLATSEMAQLYYGTLANAGGYDTSGVQQPCDFAGPNYCLTNTGPFSNIQASGYYWSGTTFAPPSTNRAWEFVMGDGFQYFDFKTNGRYAWAVASGDVLNAVPVPPAVWLFGSAVGVMGWLRRKTS